MRDNRTYKTIKIGSQVWMAENLNVGSMILSNKAEDCQNNNETIEKYCHSNLKANCDTYGGLYQWDEMMDYNPSDSGKTGTTQGICPKGWHIPTDIEWQTLIDFLGGDSIAGGKLKSNEKKYWFKIYSLGSNESLFSGLPGGYRSEDNGLFYGLRECGKFLSATVDSNQKVWTYILLYSNSGILRYDDFKAKGHSVRCIKDK